MFINQIGNSYVTMLKAGYPINVFYGYVTDGLFQNWGEVNRHATQPGTAPGDIRFRDLNNDGVINDEDRTILGNPNPNWFFSLSNNLSYKDGNSPFSCKEWQATRFIMPTMWTTKEWLPPTTRLQPY